ncbi:hypothetical protein [Aliikangiella sp. IMCC44359]|uniref:hypothetical protein n=1 Tax=Aliikangiella sp. IMCC44359 TaxID=3459125 RepID=UPI00403A7DF5
MSEKPENIGMDNKPALERDRIDLANEIIGDPTGRIQRFLSENRTDIYGQSEKQKQREHLQTMLRILLEQDAQYAALYAQVLEKLDETSLKVERALDRLNKEISVSESQLNAMEANEETSSDAYKEQREHHETLLRHRQEIEEYQRDVLDVAKERLRDEDNPLTLDELEDLKEQLGTQKLDYLTTMSTEFAVPTNSAAQELQGKADLSVPDLTASFEKVKLDIPDIGQQSGQTPTTAPAL